ncbi:MAG TPA: cupin domain-containing protein [Nitrospiraceae bacterium]|nr:cupin domain-containing protein [Nitrospiraceae bacterium]
MSSTSDKNRCDRADEVTLYALDALSGNEASDLKAHIDACEECREELAALQPVVTSFTAWPTAVLRPSTLGWDKLIARIGEIDRSSESTSPRARWVEPDWEDVAPGISCKLLATDSHTNRVSMLVRLAPGTAYPPHTHAGTEELHLLEGELWIEDRKLFPGDYNRAVAGTADKHVWSETGCTCLLITSPSDLIA